MKLTLDTNCVDDEELRATAAKVGAEVALFSVTRREALNATADAQARSVIVLPEQAVWADGFWADNVWADRYWVSGPAIHYEAVDGRRGTAIPSRTF